MHRFNEATLSNRKVGDVIYPKDNNTAGGFCKKEWWVVTRVSKNGIVSSFCILYNYDSVLLLQILKLYPAVLGGK